VSPGEISSVLIRYRADIDGLRAIAVLGVVLYHVGGLGVSGGYVGVDVFFVISGYLITGIIAREIEAGQFSLANFYQRRIRRILPALAAVAAASTLAAALILFPRDFKEYGRSLLSLAVFASNFHFARKTGYFDGAADDKPLLHTWSLAVEEQFYIVFPLLLWVLFRWSRTGAIWALALLAAFSLLISIDQTARMPERAFFSSSTRAWELLAGALCALSLGPMQWPRIWRECAAASGLALIAIAYLTYSDESPFPGYYAVLPCVGAVCVILAGNAGETLAGRALALPPIVGIGLISYSVYLWHWPLLVFAKYRFALAPNSDLSLSVALILASVALGYLSWRFIEQPFRLPANAARRKIVFRAAAGVLTATAATGLLIVKSNGLPGRWSEDIASLSTVYGRPACRPGAEASGWPKGTCLVGSEGAQIDTLIWGDSHAAMLSRGIVKELARTQHGAALITRAGCPPLFGVTLYGRAKKESCETSAAQVLAKLADGSVYRVILAARWAFYAEGDRLPEEGGQPIRLSPDEAGNHEVFTRLLKDTVERLKPLVRQTILIGPIPEVDFPVGRAMARYLAWGQLLPPATPRAAFERRQHHVFPVLAAIAQEPSVRVLFPDRWLCDTRVCPYANDGQPLYYDTNHLNAFGERRLEQMFHAIIVDVAGA